MGNPSRLHFSLLVTVGLLALCVVWIVATGAVAAGSTSSEWHVCPAGPAACDFDDVQAAVDGASPGDVVKIAEGIYTDIHARAGITQVVYISKTLGLYGGYTPVNWDTPDPVAHPTTLDAGGLGRVIVISDTRDVNVSGLRITGGVADGMGGGPRSGIDAGGGIYVRALTVTLTHNEIYSNVARSEWHPCGYGGGLYLRGSDYALLEANTIHHNTGNAVGCGNGGGLHLDRSHHVLLRRNLIHDNLATKTNGVGGGLYMSDCDYATVEENVVRDNKTSVGADAYGGGILMEFCNHAIVKGNTISGNVASVPTWGYGGGLYLNGGIDVTLQDNLISGNTAAANPSSSGWGGGLYLIWGGATITNTVIIHNQANTGGSGVYVAGSAPRLLHSTIAENGGAGGAVFVDISPWSDRHSHVVMTNTIVATHTVGVTVTSGSTATLHATLWQANDADWGGAGTLTRDFDYTGDPDFEADGYHLGPASAAIDKGVNAGVMMDIDGEARPRGAAFDLGADEFVGTWSAHLPLIMRR